MGIIIEHHHLCFKTILCAMVLQMKTFLLYQISPKKRNKKEQKKESNLNLKISVIGSFRNNVTKYTTRIVKMETSPPGDNIIYCNYLYYQMLNTPPSSLLSSHVDVFNYL